MPSKKDSLELQLINDKLQVDSSQGDDVTDCDMERKIHEIDRIASQVDEKKLIKIFNPFDLLAPTTIKFKILL